MLKIGEFSVLSRISINMLRNYEKLELLVPVHVDQVSGYRYYDKSQLVDANRIVSLKSMGFGLSEIKDILQMSQEEKQAQVKNKLVQKKQELKELVDQIHRLEDASTRNDAEEDYALSIVLKTLPAMNVVGYRDTITKFNQEGLLWKKLNELVSQYRIPMDANAYAMSVQHAFDLDKDYVDTEVMLSTDGTFTIKDCGAPFEIHSFPERQVASLVFKGSYEQISSINSFIADWMEQNAYEIVDHPFSIYHMSPRECKDELQFITELCFPIKKRLN